MNMFKRSNVTPEYLLQQEKTCKVLITNLARAIKELQVMYATDGQVEHTITDCRATQRLCTWFENILSHGLRARKLSLRHSPATFWPLALKITRKQAIEQINSLQHAHSEMGRFRAWIRLAVNECSLESYVNVIVQDAQLLSQYYESYAFLNNEERTGALMRLLTGLAQLTISLEVDTMNLEYSTPLEALHAPLQKISLHSSNALRRRERTARAGGAGGEEEEGSTDDAESEGSEMSQDLLNEADFEQLLREAETFTVLPVQRSKKSSGTQQEEGTITLEPIVSSAGPNHTPSEWDTANELANETGTLNSPLDPMLPFQEDLPLERDFTPLALFILEEPDASTQRHTDVLNLVTPTTPLVTALGVDGSDDVTPSQITSEEEGKCEGISNDVVHLLLAETEGQIPEVMVSPEADCSDPRGLSGLKSPSPVAGGNDGTVEEMQRHPSPARSGGAQELEPPLDNAVSGSSSERTSPMPLMGDRLVGLVHGRNPFDDSDTEDDDEREGGGGGRDAVGEGTNESEGGCKSEEGMVTLLTHDSESLKQEDEEVEGPRLGEYPFTPEEITTILDNGEDDKLEGFLDEYDIVDALQEDYYTKEPTMEELSVKIVALKTELLSLPPETPTKLRLAMQNKLVKLQVALHWMKEVNSSGILHIMNHQLAPQGRGLVRGSSCDLCGGGIHGMIRSWFKCQDCQIACHKGCLKFITRKCVYDKARKAELTLEICPEQGLSSQHFRCRQCNNIIGAKKSKGSVARLCHYSGSYFCRDCHHKETTIIPARVVHNWDFTPYPVSNENHELLQIISTRPLIQISRMNPKLYTYIQGLKEIEALRGEILLMKVFLFSCKAALKKKLLLKLQGHPHFRNSADKFSLQDLVQVHQGTLLPEVQAIHRVFLAHIKTECQVCYSRGGSCEVCHSDQTLFPFDPQVLACHKCRALYHKVCIGDSLCALCTRRKEASTAEHRQLPLHRQQQSQPTM